VRRARSALRPSARRRAGGLRVVGLVLAAAGAAGCPSGEDAPGASPAPPSSPATPTPADSPGAGASPAPAPEPEPVYRPARWSLGLAHVQRDAGLEAAFVFEGGAADRAGLEVGDLIVAVQGRPATRADEGQARLVEALDAIGTEARLELTVRRGGEGEPEDVVVELLAVGTFEGELARSLIRSAAAQLLALRRDDGLWPSYSDPHRASVAVSAFVAYALSRVDDDRLEATREALVDALLSRHQAEDGGLDDPAEFPAHRTYATALLLRAIEGEPGLEQERRALRGWLRAEQLQEARGFALYDWRYGGWSHYGTYELNVRTDVSTARFALQGLDAAGVGADDAAWGRARLFLDATQNFAVRTGPEDPAHRRELSLRDGGFAFTPRMSKAGGDAAGPSLYVYASYGSATADGALARLFVEGVDARDHTARGLPVEDPAVVAALRWLARQYTLAGNPGFAVAMDEGWPAGTRYYFRAALAECLHRAGVAYVRGPAGVDHAWASELVLTLANVHARGEGRFLSDSPLMHEDHPPIAAGFALIALAAARDRLDAGGGALLEPGQPPLPIEPAPPPADAVARGRELFRARGCVGCHADVGGGSGPSLVGIGDIYLGRPERLRRYLTDPDPERALRTAEREYAERMPPAPVEDDAELDDLVTFLLSRHGDRPVSD